MRERTPSADDTPARTPPTPQASSEEIASEDAVGCPATLVNQAALEVPGPRIKMVASSHSLEELGVTRSSGGVLENKTAQIALDKRSRLSNVINNLRKKVPEALSTEDQTRNDERNSVERNLENLQKYVMTVLNGVIKDEAEKADVTTPTTVEGRKDVEGIKAQEEGAEEQRTEAKEEERSEVEKVSNERVESANEEYLSKNAKEETEEGEEKEGPKDEVVEKSGRLATQSRGNKGAGGFELIEINASNTEMVEINSQGVKFTAANLEHAEEEEEVLVNEARSKVVEKEERKFVDLAEKIKDVVSLTIQNRRYREKVGKKEEEDENGTKIRYESKAEEGNEEQKIERSEETISQIDAKDRKEERDSEEDDFSEMDDQSDESTLRRKKNSIGIDEGDENKKEGRSDDPEEETNEEESGRNASNENSEDEAEEDKNEDETKEPKEIVSSLPPGDKKIDGTTMESTRRSLHCSLPLDKVGPMLRTCKAGFNDVASSSPQRSPSRPSPPVIRHLCLYCDRKFLSISLRQRHTERIHQIAGTGGSRRSERTSRKQLQSCQYCSEKGETIGDSEGSSSSLDNTGSAEGHLDTLDGLFRHMAGHHPDKYYACVRCSTRYSSRENLASHTTEAHGNDNGSVKSIVAESYSSDLGSPQALRNGTRGDKRAEEEVPATPESHQTKKEPFSSPGSPEFDSSFYSSVSCNIRENLLHHIDGKLEAANAQTSSNPPPSASSQTPQQPQTPQHHQIIVPQAQLPIDISLTAATPVYTKEYSNDLENSSEYAQRPGKTRTHPRRVSFEKYNFPRKYDGKEAWSCSIKDLSKFDISTQLSLRKKQRNGTLDASSSTFSSLESQITIPTTIQSGQTELDESQDTTCENEVDIASVPSEESSPNSPRCSDLNADSVDRTVFTKEFANFMRLNRFNENESDGTESAREIVYAELTGEWSRPRIYICGACALRYVTLKEMEEHKSSAHPNVWCSHFEFSGDQRDLYKHLFLPGRVTPTEKARAAVSPEKICTKCARNCNTLAELHRHMLECGGDQTWLLGLFGNGKKKCKWRPFGSRSRRRRQRGMKRNIQNSQTPRANTPRDRPASSGPRVRPSDRESIQKMLANLPPKRASRKVLREENLARCRSVRTRSRPGIGTEVSSTAMQSRNKTNLKNKLLKNAKSFQRNRTRIDNITAAIESVVSNQLEREDDEQISPRRRAVEAAARSAKMPSRPPGVPSKKKNLRTKSNNNSTNVEQPRLRRNNSGLPRLEVRLNKNAAWSSKTSTPKTSGRTSTITVSSQSLKIVEVLASETPNGKKKKTMSPVALLNASIKAKQQPRTQDGKFRRTSIDKKITSNFTTNGEELSSMQRQTRRSNSVNGRFLATSRFRATREFNRKAAQVRKRVTRMSLDTENGPRGILEGDHEDVEKFGGGKDFSGNLTQGGSSSEQRISRGNSVSLKSEKSEVAEVVDKNSESRNKSLEEDSIVGRGGSKKSLSNGRAKTRGRKNSPKNLDGKEVLDEKRSPVPERIGDSKARSKGKRSEFDKEEETSFVLSSSLERAPRRTTRNSLSRDRAEESVNDSREEEESGMANGSEDEARIPWMRLRKSTRNLTKRFAEKHPEELQPHVEDKNDRLSRQVGRDDEKKLEDEEASLGNSASTEVTEDAGEDVSVGREVSKKGGRCLGKRRGRIKYNEDSEGSFEDATSSTSFDGTSKTDALVNPGVENVQRESSCSNVDSGKENSTETILNIPKPRLARPRKSKGARTGRERVPKRGLGGVIGILTEGVNIPVEIQQSVVLTVQMPVAPANLESTSLENEIWADEEPRNGANDAEVVDSGGNRDPGSGNGEECEQKPSESAGREAEEASDTAAKTKLCETRDQVELPVTSSRPEEAPESSTIEDRHPSNDIIMDLSRRRPRRKGSFLEKIVSKIAKQKDVTLLDGDVGSLLDNAAEELTNILDEVAPNLIETTENVGDRKPDAKSDDQGPSARSTPKREDQGPGESDGAMNISAEEEVLAREAVPGRNIVRDDETVENDGAVDSCQKKKVEEVVEGSAEECIRKGGEERRTEVIPKDTESRRKSETRRREDACRSRKESVENNETTKEDEQSEKKDLGEQEGPGASEKVNEEENVDEYKVEASSFNCRGHSENNVDTMQIPDPRRMVEESGPSVDKNVGRSKKRSSEANMPKKNKRQSVDTEEPEEPEDLVDEELCLADIMKLIQKPTSRRDAKANGRRNSLTDKEERDNETTRPGKRKTSGESTRKRDNSKENNGTGSIIDSRNENVEAKRPKRKAAQKKSLVDEHLLLSDDDEEDSFFVRKESNARKSRSSKETDRTKSVARKEEDDDTANVADAEEINDPAKTKSSVRSDLDPEEGAAKELSGNEDNGAVRISGRRRSSKRKSLIADVDTEGVPEEKNFQRNYLDDLNSRSRAKNSKRSTEVDEESVASDEEISLDRRTAKRKSETASKSIEKKTSDDEDSSGKSKKVKTDEIMRTDRKRNSKKKLLADDHLDLLDDKEDPEEDALRGEFKEPSSGSKTRRTSKRSSIMRDSDATSGNEEASDASHAPGNDDRVPEAASNDATPIKKMAKSLVDEHLALSDEEEPESVTPAGENFTDLEELQTTKKRTSANFTVGHTKTGEILIVEKKKKLTKEVAKFFCEVCATSFTRKSSLKKHNSSQSHLIQMTKMEKLPESSLPREEDTSTDLESVLKDVTNDPTSPKPEEGPIDETETKIIEECPRNIAFSVPEEADSQSQTSIPTIGPACTPVTAHISEEEALEEELLDEEICKITENMTHDDFVLTDHVTPEVPSVPTAKEPTPKKDQPKVSNTQTVPKSKPTSESPITSKNLDITRSNKTLDVSKPKQTSVEAKTKKRNLAEEHLDLDSPSPPLAALLTGADTDFPEKLSSFPKSETLKTLQKSFEAPESPRIGVSLPISIVSNNPEDFSIYSKSNFNVNSSDTEKYPLRALTDSLPHEPPNHPLVQIPQISPSDSSSSDLPLAEVLKSSLPIGPRRGHEYRRSPSPIGAQTPKSPPKASSDSPRTGLVPIAPHLDFLNIAQKLRTPERLTATLDSSRPIGAADFDSDDSTTNTRIIVDIQKLINDPKLGEDQPQKTTENDPEEVLFPPKNLDPIPAPRSNRRSKLKKPVRRTIPLRLDSSDNDESEVDVSDTQIKNKIVKSVFGRVFAGADKADKSDRVRDKVKEVLDDWESRSEDDVPPPRSPTMSSGSGTTPRGSRRKNSRPRIKPPPNLSLSTEEPDHLAFKSRKSKKRAEERISKTLEAESANSYSVDSEIDDRESKFEQEIESPKEDTKVDLEIQPTHLEERRNETPSLSAAPKARSPFSAIVGVGNKSTTNNRDTETSATSDSEDDTTCGRLSPTFVCDTPVDTSDSSEEDNDTVPEKPTISSSFVLDEKERADDDEPKLVIIAPNDAVEDNALDVPRVTHHPQISSTPQKPRQPKILNCDEELFVECCSRLKATTENELRGAKKIELDHSDGFHGKVVEGTGRRTIRDRWRDAESRNSLGSLLESVNQLLGEEVHGNAGNEDTKRTRSFRSTNSSRSVSPDLEISGPPDNPGYEDSLDVAFEHNNKLRDKIQQRMRESENLISSSFSSEIPDARHGSYVETNPVKTLDERMSVSTNNKHSSIHDEQHAASRDIALDSTGFKHKITSTLGGLLDKALSNLLHNTGKHDHNVSTPMKVLAELACARAPTSTTRNGDNKNRDRSNIESSIEISLCQKDAGARKFRNPIRELFERKKELNERNQTDKNKAVAVAVAALKELNVQRQRKTTNKSRRRRQEFPLVRKNSYGGGLAEKKKRRDAKSGKKDESISSLSADKPKDVYDFDDEESRTDVGMTTVASYRSKSEKSHPALAGNIDMSGITSRTIIETLENGKQADLLGQRLESMIDRKFKEFEKSTPKTKAALKAFHNDRSTSKERNEGAEEPTERVMGPMDDFVERKQHSKRGIDTGKRSKSRKRSGNKTSKKKSRTAWYENDSSDEFRTAAKTEDVGVGISKSQRTCSKGKQNLFAELSTSSESEAEPEPGTEPETEPEPEVDAGNVTTTNRVEMDAATAFEELTKSDARDAKRVSEPTKKTRNYSETKKSESEMSDHPLVIDERRESDDESVRNNYEASFEMDDLYREDSSDEEDEEPKKETVEGRTENAPISETKVDEYDQTNAIPKTKYLQDDELIPLEEALELLDKPEMLGEAPTATEHPGNREGEEDEGKIPIETSSGKASPELPEKLLTNEKPTTKESDNLPLHVFLSRKVQESKKRKQQHLKKLQEEQERILLELQPTRRQRKCAIGKQGLLAEISSSDEDETEGSRKHDRERSEAGEKARKQKRESREKRKERYIEKKHEQIIVKEQKAIQEEILRQFSQRKNHAEDETTDDNATPERKVSPKKMKKSKTEKEDDEKRIVEEPDVADPKDTEPLDASKSKKLSKTEHKTPSKKIVNSNGKPTRKHHNGGRSSSDYNSKDVKEQRRSTSTKHDSTDEELPTTKCWDKVEEGVGVAIGRRKRSAANQLYYWSSSSDEEEEEVVEPASVVAAEEDRQEQHGWIVGDSHKRMITMLAMEKQLKEKRRRSEDEFDTNKGKPKKYRNSTS